LTRLSEFFTVLSDYKWHNLREIAKIMKVKYEKVVEVAKLFEKVGIVQYDKKRDNIRINEEWNFLVEEKRNSTR